MTVHILGWAATKKPPWGDESGTCHLLVDRGDNVARVACGSKVRTSGQCHSKPPDYAPHACKRCLRIEEKDGTCVGGFLRTAGKRPRRAWFHYRDAAQYAVELHILQK